MEKLSILQLFCVCLEISVIVEILNATNNLLLFHYSIASNNTHFARVYKNSHNFKEYRIRRNICGRTRTHVRRLFTQSNICVFVYPECEVEVKIFIGVVGLDNQKSVKLKQI